MFHGASSFNNDLLSWDVSGVVKMSVSKWSLESLHCIIIWNLYIYNDTCHSLILINLYLSILLGYV